jgi:hypothetical protein
MRFSHERPSQANGRNRPAGRESIPALRQRLPIAHPDRFAAVVLRCAERSSIDPL